MVLMTITAVSLAACATEGQPINSAGSLVSDVLVSEEECADAVSSFSVIPTFEQNVTERRRLLDLIKEAQEERYGESCASYSGWNERFSRAYSAAYSEARLLDPVEVYIMEEPSNYVATPECFVLLKEYEESLMKVSKGVDTDEVHDGFGSIDDQAAELKCFGDVGWRISYLELRARGVASGVLPSMR